MLLRDASSVGRDELISELARRGIETRPVFYPVHMMPPYREPDGSYPRAESYAAQGISLPTHGQLTRADVEYTCQQIVEALSRNETTMRNRRRTAA